MRFREALKQIGYLQYEFSLLVNRRWWRLLTVPLSATFVGVAGYRLERCLFLLLGRAWPLLRGVLSPISFLLRPWTGRVDIHYGADIGPGLRILHASAHVVVSKATVAGRDMILTGGNFIGRRQQRGDGSVRFGDSVTLGANAVVLGPLTVGSGVTISAASLVVRDVGNAETVAGVPARLLFRGADVGPPGEREKSRAARA